MALAWGALKPSTLAALAEHLSSPLRTAIGSNSGAWGGPFGNLAFLELIGFQQQPHESSRGSQLACMPNSRGIQTSAAAAQRRGFQSVLRKPVPKAIMLNKDNFMMWRDQGFDTKVAETILEQTYFKKWQKLQQAESHRLQLEVYTMLQRCSTAAELGLVVEQLGGHMAPETLVTAICKAARLSLATTSNAPQAMAPATHSDLMGSLLLLLESHCDVLRTGQLAAVLAAVATARHRLAPSSNAALQAQLEGDCGLERVDAAGPKETAALMSACSRLAWGDAQLWERMGDAALAQLAEMSPGEVAMALRAASTAPRAAGSALGPKSLLWVHAEQVLLERMAKEFRPAILAQVLLSFAVSGTAAGGQLHAALEAQLVGRWSSVPPEAVVDIVRSCSKLMQQQSEHSVRAGHLLQQACHAATYAVTHLSMHQLEQLLSAVQLSGVVAPGSRGDGAAATQLPGSVVHLLELVGAVLRIRGLEGQQAGAVPAPLAAHGRQTPGIGCKMLLLLVQMGVPAATLAPLLHSLLAPAKQLLEAGKLPAGSASCLVQAYVLAGQQAPLGAARKLAVLAAGVLQAGAPHMAASAAVHALVALAESAAPMPSVIAAAEGQEKKTPKQKTKAQLEEMEKENASVQRALGALADRLAAGQLSNLTTGQLRDVRTALATSGLQSHVLAGMIGA